VLSEESASSTILSFSQSHFPDWSEVMAGTNVRGLLSTFWRCRSRTWSTTSRGACPHFEGEEVPAQPRRVSTPVSRTVIWGSRARPSAVRASQGCQDRKSQCRAGSPVDPRAGTWALRPISSTSADCLRHGRGPSVVWLGLSPYFIPSAATGFPTTKPPVRRTARRGRGRALGRRCGQGCPGMPR
jgi:hypothetical protein